MGLATAEPLPQHLAALAKANLVRCTAALAKREIAAGRLSIEEAFDDPRLAPELIGRIIRAQTRWGVGRTQKAIRRAGLSPGAERKRLGDLTERQKTRLLVCIADPDRDFFGIR